MIYIDFVADYDDETKRVPFGHGKTWARTMYDPAQEDHLEWEPPLNTQWPAQSDKGSMIDMRIFI